MRLTLWTAKVREGRDMRVLGFGVVEDPTIVLDHPWLSILGKLPNLPDLQ